MRFLIILCFFLSPLCLAETNDRSKQFTTEPRMFDSDNGLQEMQLVELGFDVVVNQAFAETSVTMTFRNRSKQTKAGDLVFPLPETALISGYAVDINGVMVDATIVKKEKTRLALETSPPKAVNPDPAVRIKGNNYKSTVSPIPSDGVRIVRVNYISDLTLRGTDLYYQLPLNFEDKLEKFDLNIKVVKPNSPPMLLNQELGDFKLEKENDNYVGGIHLKNVMLSDRLTLKVSDVEKKPVSIEQAADGEFYFSIIHKVSRDVLSDQSKTPKTISIIWDASGSREKKDHDRELTILEAYLKSITSNSSKKINVKISLLRNTLAESKEFIVSKNDGRALFSYIRNIDYDGGTQFNAIHSQPSVFDKTDLILIFTDGLSNFGEAIFGRLISAPAFVISNDGASEHSLLQHIASSTGGNYFNLKKQSDTDVINAIGNVRVRYSSYGSEIGSFSDVIPTTPESINDYSIFTGKLKKNKSLITLHFTKINNTFESKTYELDRRNASNGNLLRSVWAKAKINHLQVHDKNNVDAFFELSRTYGLLTPRTSLQVLETLKQHIKHNVTPPEHLTEIRVKYGEYEAEKKEELVQAKEIKIKSMIHTWSDRIDWWKAKFPVNTSPINYSEKKTVTGVKSINQSSMIVLVDEEIVVTSCCPLVHRPIDPKRITTEIVDFLPSAERETIRLSKANKALVSEPQRNIEENDLKVTSSDFISMEFSNFSNSPAAFLAELSSVKPSMQINTYYKLREKHKSSAAFFFEFG